MSQNRLFQPQSGKQPLGEILIHALFPSQHSDVDSFSFIKGWSQTMYRFRNSDPGRVSLSVIAAASIMLSSPLAYAAQHSGGGDSHSSQDSGSHSGSSGHDSGTDHGSSTDHGSKGQKGKGGKGRPAGETGSRGHGSLEDIFREIGGEEEDSDRPEWAGQKGGRNEHGGKPAEAGSARGDLYGDMYVILRDANGEPVLNEQGFVQPIDANGNPIPLDEEGAPIDPTLAQEVEMGRLNVGRAPDSVLEKRAEEVITLLNGATYISLDPAGRLVVTADGATKTIDAPLENLAIYVALMTQGSIPGVTDLPGIEFDHLVDGKITNDDLVSATSFLAAAADKFSTVSLDAVAYMNAILGINTVTQGTVTYSNMDYSSFSYDRAAAYNSVTADVLVKQADGSWLPSTVNIYEAVFADQPFTSSGEFEAFAQSVDDARAVINFIHEYAVPADSVSQTGE